MPPKRHHETKAVRLKVVADTEPLLSAIAAIQVANRSLQALDRGIDIPHSIAELVSIQSDVGPAVGAGVLRVRFEPSDRLCKLVAALGTGNLDLTAV
jgi:hypothetical protein